MASTSPSLAPSTEPGAALFASPSPMPMGAPPPELVVWPYLLQLTVFTAVLGAVALYGLRYLKGRFPQLQIGLGLTSSLGLQVVDRVNVDAKRSVFVVKLGGRAWLLAATDQHVTTVAELDPEDMTGGPFDGLVEKENKRHGTP